MRARPSPNQLELWDLVSPATATATQETLFTSEQLDALATSRHSLDRRAVATPANTTKLFDANFARRRPLKILVADDNEINRKVIRIILQKLGYSCVEASNGEDALRLYQDGEYDYIFMDLDMPEMDGIEATLAIRDTEAEKRHQAEIIAVTANVSQETRRKCRRAGMNGYLEKPITARVIKDQLLRSWTRIRTRRGSK